MEIFFISFDNQFFERTSEKNQKIDSEKHCFNLLKN